MRIMHLDYPQSCGETDFPKHSVLVLPDTNMFTANINNTITTGSGYVGSKMRTKHLRRAEAIFKACFGADHVLSYTEYLINAVTNGQPSGCAEYNCTVELMDERMIFGSYQIDSGTHDETVAPEIYLQKHIQLVAFSHSNELIGDGVKTCWLRNVASATSFARVDPDGNIGSASTNSTYGVRPFALIC